MVPKGNEYSGMSTVEAVASDGEQCTESAATIDRRHDLDALRAVAMLLGIALHGALAYIPLPDAGWAVHDSHQHEAYGIFMAAIHGFRMPLFFLVSGFFTAMLWRKRGLPALLKHRFKRIFLPLLIGTFTIVPAVWIVSIAAVFLSGGSDGGEANVWTAAQSNDAKQLQQLIKGGASLDDLDPALAATPMTIAAIHGSTEAIELLIAGGADVNARNRDGTTPLHRAALFGRTGAVRILLEHGADPSLKDRLGETAVDMLEVGSMRRLGVAAVSEIDMMNLPGRQEVAALFAESTQSQGDRTSNTHTDSTRQTDDDEAIGGMIPATADDVSALPSSLVLVVPLLARCRVPPFMQQPPGC